MVLGTAIGRVKANDQDVGENAQSSYDIIDGDGTALFEITSDAQAQDGIIRLRKVSEKRFCSSLKHRPETWALKFVGFGWTDRIVELVDIWLFPVKHDDYEDPFCTSNPLGPLHISAKAQVNSYYEGAGLPSYLLFPSLSIPQWFSLSHESLGKAKFDLVFVQGIPAIKESQCPEGNSQPMGNKNWWTVSILRNNA